MPYSGANDPDLPDYVQEQDEDVRAYWVEVFNGVFEGCDDDADQCERIAIATANERTQDEFDIEFQKSDSIGEVMRGDYHSMHINLSMFGFPEVLTAGTKPFPGFAAGEFETFWRTIKVEPEELPTYMSNTKRLIEGRQRNGEPGLPIDAERHDGGKAAGWITDISPGNVKNSMGETVPVLMMTPKWTSLGVELITDKIMTNFSPTFYSHTKQILGGSLTNWPGSVDANEVPLFPAVQLSRPRRLWGMRQNTEQIVNQIVDKLSSVFGLQRQDDGVEDSGGESMPDNMGITLDALSPEDRAELEKQARLDALKELGLDEDITPDKIKEQVNLDALKGITDPAILQQKVKELVDMTIEQQFEDLDRLATQRMQEMFAQRRRTLEVQQFCRDVTGGTTDVPYGLKVKREDLESLLLGMEDSTRKKFQEILSRIWESGRIDFGEYGHGRERQGDKVLEPLVASQLKEYLEQGGSVEMFFETAGDDLGEMAQYNLSEYKDGG